MGTPSSSSTPDYARVARRQLYWDARAARSHAAADGPTLSTPDTVYTAIDCNLRLLAPLADPPVTPPASDLTVAQLDTLCEWCRNPSAVTAAD